jgi:hypothetical protein
MRESTDRVHSALHSGNPNEQLVASRLLESPAAFRTWESEHCGLMREVANPSFKRTQAALLKKAAFRLIHRKALFEYLRKACSFLCTSHVGGNVVRDPGFFDPMRRYQDLYAEYFQIFCSTHFGADSADTEMQAELLPLLKHQLEECRMAIMNPQPGTEWLMRETELRRPAGDTVRLPRLRGSELTHPTSAL